MPDYDPWGPSEPPPGGAPFGDVPFGAEPLPADSIWNGAPLPAPLRWNSPPDPYGGVGYIVLTDNTTIAGFEEGWRALAELAQANNLVVTRYTNGRYSDSHVVLPGMVYVQDASRGQPSYGTPESFDPPGPCAHCGAEVPLGSVKCPSCARYQECTACLSWASSLFPDDGTGRLVCGSCSIPCLSCGIRSEFELCASHADGVRANCVRCGNYTDEGSGSSFSDYYDGTVCDECRPAVCAECGEESGDPYYVDERSLCEPCAVALSRAEHGTEEFEPEEKLEQDLFIDAIPGRENIRRCGLEIEGAGNWRNMGRLLYDSDLTGHPSMLEYHSSTNEGPSDRWSLERDGSVDWELVSPPINLADRDNVRQLRGVLKVVREEIKSGSVSFDMRCGLHIHVGAERTAIGGAFNLGTIWGYLEDVIFRLGAAKWPKHRAIINGVHYCRPTQKGAKTRLEFGLQLENQAEPRYNALSFNNYVRAMSRNCSCGAVRYDSWDQCVCDLGKCTFEFRVFNTSANMHKIHAYLALCQSLVAYATNRADLDTEAFPAQTFVPKMLEDLGSTVQAVHLEDWKPRLEFMFNELPLTDSEKSDLLYCVRSSELSALGDEFINTLAPNIAQEVLV